MNEQLNQSHSSDFFPPALYIAAYDICGNYQDTGLEKTTQKTGIVTHTNQLVEGFSRLNPSLEITVSQTGTPEGGPRYLTTPEGQTIFVTSFHAKHPMLEDPITNKVSPAKVAFHYETDVHNPNNPIYRASAEHYAADIRRANTAYALLQNPNPLVGVLKAEELGYIDHEICEKLRITSVIHDTGNDTASYVKRFEYITERLKQTSMDVTFITISHMLYKYLIRQGIPEDSISLIPNGIDVDHFDASVKRAKNLGIFASIRARDDLPADKKLILSASRRILWKGHQVMIEAARLLKEQGKLDDAFIAFAGKNLVDARSVSYEDELEASVRAKGLSDSVFFLDAVSSDELAACYGEAYLSLLPSTRPEGFPYVSLESMIAGVPLISSRLGGPIDYIVHKHNGLFVEPSDPLDLANAINHILSSPSLHAKIIQNGRQTAKQYSLERMIQGYARAITRTS